MKAVPLESGEPSRVPPRIQRGNKGISILDLVLRAVAIVGTLASAVAMGTTNETLPFFNQFIQFKAEYNDLPAFTFFVIVNSVVCFYLVLSIPMSIFHIVRSGATVSRVILIFLDAYCVIGVGTSLVILAKRCGYCVLFWVHSSILMLALLAVGASAAAAIVYLAHKGNASANWLAICQQFNNFCERVSGSLIGSFGGVLVFIVLILLSAIALCRRP